MSRAISPSTQQRYGVVLVTEEFGVARSTYYGQRESAGRSTPAAPQKRGPKTAFSDAVLLEHIRRVLEASPFLGEGHRKVWARLRHAGIRTSKPRVLRVMREAQLLAPSRARRVAVPVTHDGTITTDRPDVMWGTDITTTVTVEDGQVAVFVAVDHCTAEGVGIHAATTATRYEALEPIRQGVRAHFGGYGPQVATGLRLRHDHGSQYMSDVFQTELRLLGVTSSPAFVRMPEGNGVAERFIRTLKEQLLWVRVFQTVEDLRQALHAWMRTYNEEWLIERHGHRAPAAVRRQWLAAQAA
jgi:transposase InsO family protein